MDDAMGHMLCTGTQMEHRKKLGAGIDDQPKPEHVLRAAQPGSQFIQLEVREPKMAAEALVQGVRVPACTREPPRNRGVSKAEDPFSRRRIQPFGQRREHHSDLL
jgi:hypothetical protein